MTGRGAITKNLVMLTACVVLQSRPKSAPVRRTRTYPCTDQGRTAARAPPLASGPPIPPAPPDGARGRAPRPGGPRKRETDSLGCSATRYGPRSCYLCGALGTRRRCFRVVLALLSRPLRRGKLRGGSRAGAYIEGSTENRPVGTAAVCSVPNREIHCTCAHLCTFCGIPSDRGP